MTIEWRYTVEQDLGILSVSGHLGPDAVRRFAGAVGWVVGRGSGPVIVDLTELRGWSAEGQLAITEAARRLAAAGREPGAGRDPRRRLPRPRRGLPAHPRARRPGRRARRTQHTARRATGGRPEWRTTGWPTGDDTGE